MILLHLCTILYFLTTCFTSVYANTETFQVVLPSTYNNTNNNVSIDQIIDMKDYHKELYYTIDINTDKDIFIQFKNLPQKSKYSFKLCWTAIDSIDLSFDSFIILPNSIISFKMTDRSFTKDIITSHKYHINVSLTRLRLGLIPDELIPILFTIITTITISILSIYLYKTKITYTYI